MSCALLTSRGAHARLDPRPRQQLTTDPAPALRPHLPHQQEFAGPAGCGGNSVQRDRAEGERGTAPVRGPTEYAQRRGCAHSEAPVRGLPAPVRGRAAAPPHCPGRRTRAAAAFAAAPDPAQVSEESARRVAAQLSVSEEECEALLESNNIALFVDNLRAETAEAKRALRDVEARHEELARLEAALVDVRDLFTQLAHLVAQQQDQVDSVEYYALQATEHVGSGGTQLLKGTVSRTKARKKKLGLIVCLAAGFAIVLLVLVLT
ncbi:syntaxin-like isoform X2 [Spodoptera litura]|uniref:Syntaxin-like isoform X2 n=1 Tax=Spodoptera litura TaxID=69820 RepID=A0A9J7IH58_SPOLT|nr:syntaxin-like isoform X2 [Spodoptera litura]